MIGVTTVSGESINFRSPDKRNIRLDDIAWALSRIARFAGQTMGANPLTVAQHSCDVAAYVMNTMPAGLSWDEGQQLARAALLHDAHEAYMGDIPSPVAAYVGEAEVTELKRKLQAAIHARFDLPEVLPETWRDMIKLVDHRILLAERNHFQHEKAQKSALWVNYETDLSALSDYTPLVASQESAFSCFVIMARCWGCC